MRDSSWTNFAGDQSCAPAVFERPRSRVEVAESIARAGEAGRTVRVAGAGHSFNDAVLTDGTLLSIDRLDGVLDVDRTSGLVRVEAGISLGALSEILWENGLAFANLGDIDVQSLAGAAATGTHGTGAKLANVSASLASIELATAGGGFIELDAESDRDAWRAARIAVGSLGVMTAVTLRAVPAFTLDSVETTVPVEETLDGIDELVAANDHFGFFTFPHSDLAIVKTSNRIDTAPRPRRAAIEWFDDVAMTNYAFWAICLAGRARPAAIPALNRLTSRLAGTTRLRDRSYRVFRTPRKVPITEMEYAIPAGIGGGGGSRRARRRRAFRRAGADRGPVRGRRRRPAQSGRRGRLLLDRGPPVRRSRLAAVVRCRRGDPRRLRRAPALGQAALPDGARSARLLSGLGRVRRGPAAPRPRRPLRERVRRPRTGTPRVNLPLLHDRFPELRATLPHLPLTDERPTPVRRIDGLAGGDTELWLKDDGAYGNGGWGGNKVRKLEWLLPDIRRRGRSKLLTVGGIGTNWGLAAALYGREQGIEVILALIDQPEDEHVRAQLERLAASGATIHRTRSKARTIALAPWLLARHHDGLHPPYLLPAGGSSPVGALGYVEAALEIATQVEAGELPEPAHVVTAVGSGGTAAGLALGLRIAGLGSTVTGVVVNDSLRLDRATLTKLAVRSGKLLAARGAPGAEAGAGDLRLESLADWLGPGYGYATPESERARSAAAGAGLRLDPVYTAKSMAATLELARSGRFAEGPVLFVLTDGPRPRPADPSGS